jgi:hypothetical protein
MACGRVLTTNRPVLQLSKHEGLFFFQGGMLGVRLRELRPQGFSAVSFRFALLAGAGRIAAMNHTRLPLTLFVALACLVGSNLLHAASPLEPQPFRVAASVPDLAELPSPAAVKLQGFLGRRVELNASARLAKVDLEPLLAGFRQKPGVHPWIGEHLGKWLHAATLAWAYTGDPALKAKLDYAVAELGNAQEPDGYLGTYVPDKRFGLHAGADWDVWSHKYCLMGLLTYYQYTGSPTALANCAQDRRPVGQDVSARDARASSVRAPT